MIDVVKLAATADADDHTLKTLNKHGHKGFYILKGPSNIRSKPTPSYMLESVSTSWVGWLEAKYLDLIG